MGVAVFGRMSLSGSAIGGESGDLAGSAAPSRATERRSPSEGGSSDEGGADGA